MHCENFSQGGEIVLHSKDGSSKKITNYDDIAQSFPHLSDDFKNQVIKGFCNKTALKTQTK